MSLLHLLGYKTITLSQLTDALCGGVDLPRHAFVVTFDDGYIGVHDCALPVLAKYGFTATCFLIAEEFALRNSGLPQRAFPSVNKEQVRDMLAAGFTIGSHSMSHARLTELSPAELHVEVRDSRRVLEDQFSVPVSAFAYPYGAFDRNVEAAVEGAGYDCACSTLFGATHLHSDRFHLKRIAVGGSPNLLRFTYRTLVRPRLSEQKGGE